MIQEIELTDKEQIKLYMKNCSKKELAKMLTEANKHLKKQLTITSVGYSEAEDCEMEFFSEMVQDKFGMGASLVSGYRPKQS